MSAPRDVMHLDLSQGLNSLMQARRCALAVLWWHDLPLGQLALDGPAAAADVLKAIAPAIDAYLAADPLASHRWRPLDQRGEPLPLLEAALAELDNLSSLQPTTPKLESEDVCAQREGLLEGGAGPSNASRPARVAWGAISVVVPTRDRPEELAACLESLAALREQPLEIIVVDNSPGASPATRQVVASFEKVRYVAEPRRGSSAARNAGVAASRGELIAFVDDDETVHPDWLAWLAGGFRDPRVGLVTGLVLPAELATEAQQIFEQRYSFARGYVARTFDADLYRATRSRGVPVWEIGGSGNMAIRRDVFERLEGFDERLGAGRAGGCEELELFYRALAAGWSCRYEPRAVTHHRHRRDMASLKRQLRAYMRGHVAAALTQWAGHRDTGNLRHLLWTLPTVYAGYCLRSLLGDPTYRASHLAAEIAGCLSGVGYYRQHRSRAHSHFPGRPAAARA